MTALSRTVTLPVQPGAPWDQFAWGPKAASDALDYAVHAGSWITDSGHVLAGVAVSASPDLVLSGIDYLLAGNALAGVTLRIAGGTPGTTETVRFLLALGDASGAGGTAEVLVSLRIRAAPPTGLVAVAVPPIPVGTLLDDAGHTLTSDAGTVLIPA